MDNHLFDRHFQGGVVEGLFDAIVTDPPVSQAPVFSLNLYIYLSIGLSAHPFLRVFYRLIMDVIIMLV